MRVTNSMMFNSGTQGMLDRQADLFKVQNQLSTGRRILSPQDDPIGSAEALKLSQSKAVNTQYLTNQATAQTSLGTLDTTLGTLGDALTRIAEISAGADTQSAEKRDFLAVEMKGILQNIVGLANTQDGTGLYIFGGYHSESQPFSLNSAATQPYSLGPQTYVSYSGDAGQQVVQVTASKDMNVNENGLDVFMKVEDASGSVIGRSMFDSIQNMIDQLDSSSGVPYSQASYSQAFGDIKNAITHVVTVRASVGARMNSLDSLTAAGKDVNFNYDTRLSEIQDLDYTEAISRFSNYQTQLQAAQLSFKQINQLSLFNIL